jgi:hypothetical protein
MSEFTFNIADYRPLSAVRAHRAHDARPILKKSGGFVVLTANSEPRVSDDRWMESQPAVVDIRSVRESNRTGLIPFQTTSYPRHAKILRFAKESIDRVCAMAASKGGSHSDDDPGPAAA